MAKFLIDLNVEKYNDSVMSLQVKSGNQTLYSSTNPDQHVVIEFESQLPATISLRVKGKIFNETLVDSSGQILQDKHIKINRVAIDNMPVEKWVLEKKLIKFCPDIGDPRYTNYFGSNGVGYLNINFNNSFKYFLHLLQKD